MDASITTQLETIRASFADGASPDEVRAGAIACRTLASLLDARDGKPLSLTPSAAHPSLAALLPRLGTLDIDQILDFIIAKLRAMLPSGAAPTTPRSYQLPALRLGGGS